MTSGSAFIEIYGSVATLVTGPTAALESALTFPDPTRFFNTAFKENRWDGMIRLYQGRDFMAGLTPQVIAELKNREYTVKTKGWRVEASEVIEIPPDYLAPKIPELWVHQQACIAEMLKATRGYICSPTGSGKSAIIAAVARAFWDEWSWSSLIMVPKKGLLSQTVDEFNQFYQGDIRVGQFGDGKKIMGDINIATAATLINYKDRKRKQKGTNKKKLVPGNPLLQEVVFGSKVLIIDETHHASSTTWQEIAMAMQKTVRRYGVSGTPTKNDDPLANHRLIGVTGPLLIDIPYQDLAEAKVVSEPRIVVIASHVASGPPLPKIEKKVNIGGEIRTVMKEKPYVDAYNEGVVENATLNRAIIDAVSWLADHGRQTLLICRRKAHWLLLKDLLEESGVSFMSVWGDTSIEDRNAVKTSLAAKKIQVVLATVIWDEGEDMPSLDALVLAEGVKTSTNSIQRIGRVMRRGGDGTVWVVDFAPLCHPKLRSHAAIRADTYEDKGYEVMVQTKWNTEDRDLLPFEKWPEKE